MTSLLTYTLLVAGIMLFFLVIVVLMWKEYNHPSGEQSPRPFHQPDYLHGERGKDALTNPENPYFLFDDDDENDDQDDGAGPPELAGECPWAGQTHHTA